MSNHSIIEHRANYYFLKLEEDYVEICQGKHKHCKAAILSILENWMNSKRVTASRENDLYVYLSYPQFVKQMFGLYERSTVITSLKELEQEGLILKRPFRDTFNQVTFEYRLNCSVVQQALAKLSDKPTAWGSVNLNGGSVEIDGGSYEIKRGGSVNLDEGSFKNKRNIESNIDSNIEPTENTERDVATATARSQSSSPSQEIQDDETVKREAVKPSQKDTTHGTIPDSASGSTAMGNTRAAGGSHVKRQDTNKVGTPPAPDKSQTNVNIPKRPKQQPVEILISPEAQRILDDWVSLFRKKIVINQGDIEAAERLVPTNITREEMIQERLWLFSTDDPKRPWYRKIGVCLADIDKKYSKWQSLQDAPPAPTNGHNESNGYRRISSFDDPNFTMEHEFYPSEREKREAVQAAQQGVKA